MQRGVATLRADAVSTSSLLQLSAPPWLRKRRRPALQAGAAGRRCRLAPPISLGPPPCSAAQRGLAFWACVRRRQCAGLPAQPK